MPPSYPRHSALAIFSKLLARQCFQCSSVPCSTKSGNGTDWLK